MGGSVIAPLVFIAMAFTLARIAVTPRRRQTPRQYGAPNFKQENPS